MRFVHNEGDDRPVFALHDVFILESVCAIVDAIPNTMTYSRGEERVPVSAKLITFALARVLKLEIHVGFDIVHPKNRTAWYWLVTKSGAYIDIDPRLIRGTNGPVIIHSEHPFRGFHTYRSTSTINSYNMYFTARGASGFQEWSAVSELVDFIQENMHESVEGVRALTQQDRVLESV